MDYILARTAFKLGSLEVPWNVLIVLVVIVVGLMLIKSAFTLVKVALLVGACIVVYLLVKFILNL